MEGKSVAYSNKTNIGSPLWYRMKNLLSCSYSVAEEEDIYEYDLEDEAQRMLKEVKIAIEQVKESIFYAKLKEQITGDEFQEQLESVLMPNSKLKMVIYALGSLEFGFNPHYQLAIALLLAHDCSWIEGIEVYDPLFTSADTIVLKELGCEVLEVSEGCRRKVEEPTLFYMPYPGYMLSENLLEANWCPSQINRMIVLTNKFSHSEIEECDKEPKDDLYKKAIYKYINAISAENYGGMFDNIFYEFAWHFFHVNSELDMETLIAGELSETAATKDQFCSASSPSLLDRLAERRFMIPFSEDERFGTIDWADFSATYRGPRKYRCRSSTPPKGWVKLYISGIGAEGETNQAGFGGVCYNEFKETILVYNGSLGNVDGSAACVEALKRGLSSLVGKDEHKKLIVEGDDLKVIQWANYRHLPPKEVHGSLCEIFELLTKFNCVIYHIYEEANLEAIYLAKRGAMSRSSR